MNIRTNRGATVAPAILVLVVAGCDDDTTASTVDPDAITFSGTVYNALLSSMVVEGAQICAEPNVGCVTSGDDGSFALGGLPKNSILTGRVTADGFLTAIRPFETSDADRPDSNLFLFPMDLTQAAYADAGITWDPAKGAIAIVTYDQDLDHGASGYTATVSPANGDGPYFAGAATIDPNLTETSDSGGIAIINMDAGDYEVTLSGPGTCEPQDTTVSNGPNKFPAPVEDASLTYVYTYCPDGPGGGVGGGGGAGGSAGGGGSGGN